eukprot:143124_1
MFAIDGMTRMFTYLDRFHVPNSDDLLNTSEQGYTLFRQNVFEHFKQRACNAVLSCIKKERDGQEQDRELLKGSILVFIELGNKLKKVELQLYKEDFHKAFIAETKQYYQQKSAFLLDQITCPSYLIEAEKYIRDEEGRLASCLDKYSHDGLIAVTKREILWRPLDKLLGASTGIYSILERTVGVNAESAREDLARLYRLYLYDRDRNKISEFMRRHICSLGNNFIERSKEATTGVTGDIQNHELITALIDLHQRFFKIIKNEFQSDQIFYDKMEEAFKEFMNKEYYISKLLALFVNDILKKDTKITICDLENTK